MFRLVAPLAALASFPTMAAIESPREVILTGSVDWPGTRVPAVIEAADGGDVVSLRGNIPVATIGPAVVRTPYRVAYVSRQAVVGRLNVQGLRAIVTDACVRVHATEVVVRDTDCTMIGGPQAGGVNMPFGLNVTAARSLVVENSHFRGFQWRAAPNRYWNGDGISIEQDVAAASFRNVSSNDNSDAGFDVRPFAVMSNVSAAGNCRNFRFWNGGDVGTLTTGDSVKRGGISACSGIWINGSEAGARPRLHIRKLVVRMQRPGMIVEVETGPADIRIDECDIEAPRGTTFVTFEKRPGTVRLGRGCELRQS